MAEFVGVVIVGFGIDGHPDLSEIRKDLPQPDKFQVELFVSDFECWEVDE